MSHYLLQNRSTLLGRRIVLIRRKGKLSIPTHEEMTELLSTANVPTVALSFSVIDEYVFNDTDYKVFTCAVPPVYFAMIFNAINKTPNYVLRRINKPGATPSGFPMDISGLGGDVIKIVERL